MFITNTPEIAEDADADATIVTSTEELHKTALTGQMPDIEHDDVAHLPLEDIKAMVQRRLEEPLQAQREVTAATIAIDKGLAAIDDEETRENAVKGIERLLLQDDPFALDG